MNSFFIHSLSASHVHCAFAVLCPDITYTDTKIGSQGKVHCGSTSLLPEHRCEIKRILRESLQSGSKLSVFLKLSQYERIFKLDTSLKRKSCSLCSLKLEDVKILCVYSLVQMKTHVPMHTWTSEEKHKCQSSSILFKTGSLVLPPYLGLVCKLVGILLSPPPLP